MKIRGLNVAEGGKEGREGTRERGNETGRQGETE